MTELIITEKPKTAQKIAESLADKKPKKETYQGIAYYRLNRGGKEIVVGSAVGHLFGLFQKGSKKWTYPVFEVEWRPLYEKKSASHTKKYINVLKKLSSESSSRIIGTDLDSEGELIGFNVLRFICKKTDAKRMKFSALTKNDLIKAYENAAPTIEWGEATAGETRHELDWIYGINLSRALTASIKSAGMFKIMSSGRVQGPALKIIVDREKEIAAFKPVPYWQIALHGSVKEGKLEALHEKDKFWDKNEVGKSFDNAKKGKAIISEIKKSEFEQSAPHPFDLTTLQMEAYRVFGATPKASLEIAQDLYTSGFISYPRTSSQILPEGIGYRSIISALAKQKEYAKSCTALLKKELKPNNGKKTDPAHPAIYPTGIIPKKLDERKHKIYDLIVRRFLATFGESAVRETVTIKINAGGEIFIARGTTTKVSGWHELYYPYSRFKEEELPKVVQGEEVKVKKIEILDKETSPPKRYTQASIIKELERRNLGTKATRAQIIDTLYQRGYVKEKAIEATLLGIHTVETLEKYSPEILDEALTRHFEVEMEEIREKKKKREDVLEEAREVLTKILADFKKKEGKIGAGLITATKDSEEKANTVGKCPNCESGILMMRKGKFGRFIACSSYPDCKTTFKLPASGMIKPSTEICKECNHPEIQVIRARKKPQNICINLDCKLKGIPDSHEEKPCPKCKEGKMVLRRSIYGGFLACNRFPKCRNIEKIDNGTPPQA